MQNTVVQELIDIMSKVDNEYLLKQAMSLVLNSYLEAEKMQITEAYEEGRDYGLCLNGNEYYENTYKK